MRNWLRNEWIILSGASGGIGRELCKILIEKYGANVLGIGRSEEKMLSLKEELGENANKFAYRLFDVGKKENWTALKEELSTQGIAPILLVNNAGVFPRFSKTLQTPSQTFETVMQTNYLSVVYAVEEIAPILVGSYKQNGTLRDLPAIVNILSSASLCTVVGSGAYTASKSALKGYSEALQLEEKGKKYVGLIYPGTTATDLFRADEKTENSALDYVAMPAKKMARKIARKIMRKRRRAIVGWDAKLMNIVAKIAPVRGLFLIRGIMKISKSKVFSEVFEYEKKE